MQIGYAILIGAMILFLWPQAKAMMEKRKEADAPPADWGAVLLPIAAVVLFILLLIMMV